MAEKEAVQAQTEEDDGNANATKAPSLPLEKSSSLEVERAERTSEEKDPFDIQLSEVPHDPNLVNVHQFYPQLEHQFTKSNSVFVEEQSRRVEQAIQEFVEEDSTFHHDETNGDETGTLDEDAMKQLVPRTKEDSEDYFDVGLNNSADPQKAEQRQAEKAEKQEVFSTAVDEDTLQKAKQRAQGPVGSGIFQTEHWGMEKPPQKSMQEIMEESATKHFARAMELKENRDYVGCINAINKALGLKMDNIQLYVERAEAYIQLCDLQSAILNYKKVCLLEPENEGYYSRLSFLYYFQGQTLFDQCLYPEALESFARAAEMNPDNVGYHIRSITCLAALQRHGECLALVNKRLETEMDNPDLYIMRARLHEMFRNITLCYYDVKDALGLNPEHKEAKSMMEKLETRAQDNKVRAMQLNLMGKHREALQKISIAIETNPAVAEFHVLRGALHRKLGDYNAAIDDFLLALDKCDHNEDSPIYTDSQRQLLLTYNDFAVECFTKGFFEEAIILLNKAIKGEKREKGLYINRGDCFFRQEEFNFALQDYHQALDIDSSDQSVKSRISVIHNEFGVRAYQDKLYAEAESKFSLAIEFNPKVGQYYISRSRARYMMENMNGARGDLLMGLILDPTNEDVLSILSRLFPGKSVADVLGSRAAETAKFAIQGLFAPPKTKADDDDDETDRSSESSEGPLELEIESETSSQAEISVTNEKLWKPGGCFPDLKACMQEQQMNIRLVDIKKEVNHKVKGALHDRKTLKTDMPRMRPLPPPAPKPVYGGRAFQKEKIVASPAVKNKSTNWRTFSSGIGLGEN